MIVDLKEIIGMKLEDVQNLLTKERRKFRIMSLNGVSLFGTSDFKPSRVNLTVSKDIVTSYSLG